MLCLPCSYLALIVAATASKWSKLQSWIVGQLFKQLNRIHNVWHFYFMWTSQNWPTYNECVGLRAILITFVQENKRVPIYLCEASKVIRTIYSNVDRVVVGVLSSLHLNTCLSSLHLILAWVAWITIFIYLSSLHPNTWLSTLHSHTSSSSLHPILSLVAYIQH